MKILFLFLLTVLQSATLHATDGDIELGEVKSRNNTHITSRRDYQRGALVQTPIIDDTPRVNRNVCLYNAGLLGLTAVTGTLHIVTDLALNQEVSSLSLVSVGLLSASAMGGTILNLITYLLT